MTATPPIRESWGQQAELRLLNSEVFDSWFDAAASRRETIANGTIDFFHRIFTPDLYPLVGDPRAKTCLEIGYGGGRLLNAALSVFAQGYGIDVLPPMTRDFVSKRLQAVHSQSVALLDRAEAVAIPPETVDFAYSFIVFQHFDGLSEVELYIELLSRVMKSNAVGRIFYKAGPTTRVDDDEFQSSPRAETLTLSMHDVESILKSRCFEVISHGPAGPKKVWNPSGPSSSQAVVTFSRRVREIESTRHDW